MVDALRPGMRAILFDLDRTLVDLQSATDYAAALADVQTLIGRWESADVPDTDWDQPTQSCMAVLHSLLGDDRWLAVSDAIARHEWAAIPQSRAMPTLHEAVSLLGDRPAAIVTLLPADVASAAVAAHGVSVGEEGDVAIVVGRDPLIRPKPEADGLVAACEHLGVLPRDAVMIGDSSWDAEAADRAGVAFIGCPPTAFPPGRRTAPTLAEAVAQALGE